MEEDVINCKLVMSNYGIIKENDEIYKLIMDTGS